MQELLGTVGLHRARFPLAAGLGAVARQGIRTVRMIAATVLKSTSIWLCR